MRLSPTTVLFISHVRELLNNTATRIVTLENELADARAQIAELERRVAQNT